MLSCAVTREEASESRPWRVQRVAPTFLILFASECTRSGILRLPMPMVRLLKANEARQNDHRSQVSCVVYVCIRLYPEPEGVAWKAVIGKTLMWAYRDRHPRRAGPARATRRKRTQSTHHSIRSAQITAPREPTIRRTDHPNTNPRMLHVCITTIVPFTTHDQDPSPPTTLTLHHPRQPEICPRSIKTP